MRNALYRNSNLKWNLRDSDGNVVIPYIVSAHYNYREKKALTEAFRRIHANTCIRFKPRTNERDFVDIQNERGEGCYTNVGRVGGRGIIMLEANYMETCMEPSIILHELMHVAGLWHEHMRSDRDNYIKVHYENISPDYWSQFEKVTPYEATTYNVPYDYKSLMHYGKRAFAKRGRISMETLDPKFQNIIGKQTDASSSDYKKICQIYGCQNCMSGSSGSGETDEDRSDDETVEDKDDTVDPVTERPILPPSSGKCVDAMAGFCSLLSSAGMLDCGFIGRARCCASCAAQDQGKSGWMDPYSLFKDFFGFRRRY
ncbi:hypothetical protein Q1695_008745 [Nippostrongylus brasiliensis]|nr:hypothetical protein Q1695_008745 [Nippostrongylus brasiliensis]